MPKMQYESCKFKAASIQTISRANQIITQYQHQGLDLTLRQLYYQFVSRGWIENNDKEYKKLGDVIGKARMAGEIDWDAIVDRTRFIRRQSHWDSPSDLLEACAKQFRTDKWDRQQQYIEVWIEKDALIGVIEQVCTENDVPYMACRGYASASEVWRAGYCRIRRELEKTHQMCHYREATVLYLGDHDPSGIDMTRDVECRLKQFIGPLAKRLKVKRLALNMDQIELYNPPPNPTKMTDARASDYVAAHGMQCWELDALDPVVIRDLIEEAIHSRRDDELWQEALTEEAAARSHLARIAANWDDVISNLPASDEGGTDTDVPDIFDDME